MRIQKVGVIGAGTMGVGITVNLSFFEINTVLVDTSENILDEARNKIAKDIRFAPLLNKNLPKVNTDDLMKLVSFTTNICDVQQCDFIIENVTENLLIKEKIYKDLDKICGADVCFGLDTSCLSVTKIASYTKRPDKVIGIHFMNPVILKPVVEVMKGFHTSEKTIEIASAFLKQLNKDSIIVNDYPGFVSNRISHLFMNEAVFVFQDQVATAEQIDSIFKKCFGHKMGPLETADLIGLDTVVNSLNVLYQSYQDPKFKCCPLLVKMVDAGLLGRKSGKGFYDYSNL